jgi:hypothetical protein
MPTACAGSYLNVEIAKVDNPLKKARDVKDFGVECDIWL